MAGKKRVAENASGDNEAEAAATAPKTAKPRATKQQTSIVNAEPMKTRKQRADELVANNKVANDPVISVEVTNEKTEAKKRIRKGKAEATTSSENKVAQQEEPEKKDDDADDAAPEMPKVDAKQPKTRARKATGKKGKTTEPVVDSLKVQEEKDQAKPEIASNVADEAKATKPKRGAKKEAHSDKDAKEEPIAKEEPAAKVEPVKRSRKPKVTVVTDDENVAPASEEKPKMRTRNAKEVKAKAIVQEQVEEKATENGNSPPEGVAKPEKSMPKRTRRAKA